MWLLVNHMHHLLRLSVVICMTFIPNLLPSWSVLTKIWPKTCFRAQKFPNAQTWKKIKNNVFYQKCLTNTLPKSPQWLSDDHFSPRYVQKGVFDVDPYVALQIVTPVGETIKPLKISLSFTPYNWRFSIIFWFLIKFWFKKIDFVKLLTKKATLSYDSIMADYFPCQW